MNTSFSKRHIGISNEELSSMLAVIGVSHLDDLISETIPDNIRREALTQIPDAISEYQYLKKIKAIASKNKVYKNLIGQGYYEAITPSVILRNIFQNPGWYTQYTPYQSEIAQGRLEALLNFQTMVSDLTGLPIANASLLDEGTAAAEAMAMFYSQKNKRRKDNPAKKFFVDSKVYNQTLSVVLSRAVPLGIEVVVDTKNSVELTDDFFGALLQYPDREGRVNDYTDTIATCKSNDIFVCMATDLMALTLLKSPGELEADVAVGNSQRFGIPLGYGGPHAAFFATTQKFKRQIPGRIIGVSEDRRGKSSLRMALQTREQHIKREKATSNICTAQALLAIMSGMYAVYHGPEGISEIGHYIHKVAREVASQMVERGYHVEHTDIYDTIHISVQDAEELAVIRQRAETHHLNLYYTDNAVQISIDETTDNDILDSLSMVFPARNGKVHSTQDYNIPKALRRESKFLTHPVFNSYHTETRMMRYIKHLENKDLSLVHSMIPLGSCTMKLNAATQLIPVSWEEFANIHPFAPLDQCVGYQQIIRELETYLSDITGFTACTLQPNSGAQGEFTGLMCIRAYHEERGDTHRNIALIPSSAHGTNPASAVMAGMKVVVVACDDKGNIDIDDLETKIDTHKENLSSLLVTYPSTHGVFEVKIKEICAMIHQAGGLVYMDGANMNAQVGLTSPNEIGADVCHLNLHKTFSIPHGGGGPGMGPVCVNDKLKPFLPGHDIIPCGGDKGIHSISSAPYGSASILLISYAYIRLLGLTGVTDATKYAILNANYIKSRLEGSYTMLYAGENGRAAHEMIIDLRPYKEFGVSAEDVAKRLIDYGFHAPTLSFPVPGTIMIEPTESEDKREIDRFCDAMISIKGEIDEVSRGEYDKASNVLVNAPHTLEEVTLDTWEYPYTREKAAYPIAYLRERPKFWASSSRVDNAFGDRNLICTCPPIASYAEEDVAETKHEVLGS